MSLPNIRAAFEVALDAMTPALPTAWQNDDFTPTAAAYQEVALILADPDNTEISASHVKRGFFQVTLAYPLNTGPAAAEARATLLETTFPRGRSLTAGSTIVTIERTPSILPGFRDADRWKIPVRIRFFAPVTV